MDEKNIQIEALDAMHDLYKLAIVDATGVTHTHLLTHEAAKELFGELGNVLKSDRSTCDA